MLAIEEKIFTSNGHPSFGVTYLKLHLQKVEVDTRTMRHISEEISPNRMCICSRKQSIISSNSISMSMNNETHYHLAGKLQLETKLTLEMVK